jgi:hypothetical protein
MSLSVASLALGGPVTAVFGLYFMDVVWTSVYNWEMFFKKFARRHRITGMLYLIWLVFGFVDMHAHLVPRVAYHTGIIPN